MMDKINEVWSDWHEEELIGEGAYGKVYKAYREDLGHKTYSAIKIIELPHDKSEIKELSSSGMDEVSITSYYEEMAYLLMDEIKIMESLKSSGNIVVIEDYKLLQKTDEAGWTIYIRMELLKSLSEYINEHAMTTGDIVNLGIDISGALIACSEVNVIHRDIKIDNIFVNSFGRYKLGDFGIAKQLEKTQSALSQKGTGMYMAPEVYRGEKYDHTVDIYSLGIVMYRLFNNGRYPFMPEVGQVIKPGDAQESLNKRLQGKMLPKATNADEKMMEILNKACAFKATDRYTNAKEFNRILKAYVGEENIAITGENQNLEPQTMEEKTVSALSVQEDKTVSALKKREDNFSKENRKLDKRIIGIGIGVLLCISITLTAIFSQNNEDKHTNNEVISKTNDTTTDTILSQESSEENEEVPEVVKLLLNPNLYEAPASLGDSPTEPIFSADGYIYSIPCPLSEFLDNGWEISTYYYGRTVASMTEEINFLCITKDNYELTLDLINYSSDDKDVKDCMVSSVHCNYFENSETCRKDYFEFSGGFSSNADKEIYESKIKNDFEDISNNNNSVIYAYEPDRGESVDLFGERKYVISNILFSFFDDENEKWISRSFEIKNSIY